MSELFNQLGINISLLAAQGVNFLLVLVVMMTFVYRPLIKLLKERRVTIEKGLADAELAQNRLIEIEAERTLIMYAAETEGRKRLEEAEEKAMIRGKELVASATGRAYEEAKRIMEDAQSELAHERKEMEQAVRAEAASLIVRGVEKILQAEMSPTKNDELIKKLTT